MRVIQANGLNLHYADEGPRDTLTIVLVNSLGTDFRSWDAVSRTLSKQYRVIRYDKRGHGLSDATPAPYRIDDHTRDLAALMDILDIGPVLLCGLSVGGMIGLGYAESHPSQIKGLVLSSTAHRIGTREMWDNRINAVLKTGLSGMADSIIERWFTGSYFDQHPAAVAIWKNMLCRTPQSGYAGTCAAIRDADLTEAAKQISVPSLCLCGSEDVATPPDLVGSLAELIPDSEFRLIDHAGHLPCIEQPEKFVEHVQSFIKGNHFV